MPGQYPASSADHRGLTPNTLGTVLFQHPVLNMHHCTANNSMPIASHHSCINLTTKMMQVSRKVHCCDACWHCAQVKRCKTDTTDGLWFDDPERPEATNLLTMYQLCTGRTKQEVGTAWQQRLYHRRTRLMLYGVAYTSQAVAWGFRWIWFHPWHNAHAAGSQQ